MTSKVIETNGPYRIKLNEDSGKFELFGWEGELLDEFKSAESARKEMQHLIYIDCCNGDLDYEDHND